MTRFRYSCYHVEVPGRLVSSPFEDSLRHAYSACVRAKDRVSRLHVKARSWPVPDWLRIEIVSAWFFLALIALTFFL